MRNILQCSSVSSPDYGNSLFTVLMLKKKLQSLATEIDNHEPRVHMVCDNGRKLIEVRARGFEAM